MKYRPTNLLMITFVGALLLSLANPSHAQTCSPGSGPTVQVQPGQDIQSIVNSSGCGSTFMFASGIYPNFSVVPLDYDQFISSTAKGAILSGATTVANFVYKPAIKLYVGNLMITPVSNPQGSCNVPNGGCVHPEDLFFDGVLYHRVNAYTSVVSGSWYWNYTNGNIYLADNPAGHTIQIGTTRFAIGGGNITSVVVDGFVIEYYGSPANNGAVEGIDYTKQTTIPSYNWLVENNEIRYNHAAGVYLGNHMTVSGNYLHHNGEYGVAGTGNNVTVTNNEIAFNNTVNYLFAWAGGSKFVNVNNLSVTHNYSHDNNGAGLWADIENSNVDIGFNTLSNNRVAGILYEISYNGQVHDNTLTNDGVDTRGTGVWWGAGIMVANSSGIQVYNNTLTNCQNGIIEQNKNRGNGSNGQPYVLQDVIVYSNNINQSTGVAAGLAKNYPAANDIYTSWGNTFGVNGTGGSAPNSYTLNSDPLPFAWLLNNKPNTLMNLSQWQALGNN